MLPNFQSIQQTIEFSTLPLNIIKEGNANLNTFVSRKIKKSFPLNIYESRKNKFYSMKDSISNQDSSRSVFQHNHINKDHAKENESLFGLLKTRKSEIKKFKLKQFYLCSENQDQQPYYRQCELNGEKQKSSKSQSLLNTLQPRELQQPQNLICNLGRKKVLPIKLRAKSYINFSKNKQKHCIVQSVSKNELILKSSQNLVEKKYQQYLGFCCQKKQLNDIKRRKADYKNLRDITIIHLNNQKLLHSDSQKINKTYMNECIENSTKLVTQRIKRRQLMCKNDRFSKKKCNFQLNPWNQNHNQEDKQNDFSFFF